MAASFTVDQAKAKLAEMLAAETAIATGAQSYSIGGRALSRADLRWIAEQIKYYAALVDSLSRVNGGIRVRRAVPIDNC